MRKIEFVKTYIMNFMAGLKHLHDVSKELPKMYLFPALLDSSWWKFEKYKVELFAQWLFDNLSVISNKLVSTPYALNTELVLYEFVPTLFTLYSDLIVDEFVLILYALSIDLVLYEFASALDAFNPDLSLFESDAEEYVVRLFDDLSVMPDLSLHKSDAEEDLYFASADTAHSAVLILSVLLLGIDSSSQSAEASFQVRVFSTDYFAYPSLL